jgi:hypothetical protein
MQKKFFILLAVLVVILLLALWAYLFLNSNGETADELFADLGLEGEEVPGVLPPVSEPVATSSVNMDRPKLRQLTTKPVAGYEEIIFNASSTPIIYYAERGTGHIYSLDTESGKEERVSGTTFAQADKAEFSRSGEYYAVSSASNQKARAAVVGLISTSSNSVTELFEQTVTDFNITTDNHLLYTTPGTQGAVGYKQNLKTNQKTNLFAVPFFEVTAKWGTDSNDPVYIYPKPTYALEGFLYEAKGGVVSRLPASGFGFTALANSDVIIYTASSNDGPLGYIYDRNNKETRTMLAPVLPEKCYLPSSGYYFVCGHQTTNLPYTFPDNWYMGSLSFADTIFSLYADTMEGESLVDTLVESGRNIDIIDLTENVAGSALYFINKNDQTLWMYEK